MISEMVVAEKARGRGRGAQTGMTERVGAREGGGTAKVTGQTD